MPKLNQKSVFTDAQLIIFFIRFEYLNFLSFTNLLYKVFLWIFPALEESVDELDALNAAKSTQQAILEITGRNFTYPILSFF